MREEFILICFVCRLGVLVDDNGLAMALEDVPLSLRLLILQSDASVPRGGWPPRRWMRHARSA